MRSFSPISLIGLTAAALCTATQASAQSLDLKPLAEARIRAESVEQANLPLDATAVTIRVRGGVEASRGRWSALVEGQGNLALVTDYADGLAPAPGRPIIADPESIDLSRALIRYRMPTLTLTAGRQRIALDDERFVGAIAFRNNGQSFDAVRGEWTIIPGLKADVSYAWSIRTIWGVDGAGARPRSIDGDNVFANLSYVTPVGTVTGFGYRVDQDGFNPALSNQTFGVRFAGSRPLSPTVRLSYQASYARQADDGANPNDYAADYGLIDATLDVHGVRFGAGYEVLGASTGVVLTSFQTPLATAFKFQGWADRFLTTPADGVRDLYGTIGYGRPALGWLRDVRLTATAHRFHSDRAVRHYGDELNLLASARIEHFSLSARYAEYFADRFSVDGRKFWLQLDWTI